MRHLIAGAIGLGAVAAFAAGYFTDKWRHPRAAVVEFDHWSVRSHAIVSHAEQQHVFGTIILGNSIAEFVYMPTLCGDSVLDAGVGGYALAQDSKLFDRLSPIMEAQNIILAVGLNDAKWTEPRVIADFTASYGKLVDHAQETGARVWLATVGPVSKSLPYGEALFDPNYLKAINREIVAAGEERGLTVIDLNAALSDASGSLPSDETEDGVHPNASAYAKWRARLDAEVCGVKTTENE
jgi:lysophospholipase L1-like esterase